VNLDEQVSKRNTSLIKLRELGEQVIRSIPKAAAKIYTDGSTLHRTKSGSGVHIMLPNKIINTSSRNTDGTSNFTAEVKAIQIGLERFLEENVQVNQLFIISDSQSAINSVANCYTSRDDLLQTIAKLVDKLPQHTELHLQWVPSHTGILGNETADQLAKLGTTAQQTSQQPLTASEQKSRRIAQVKKSWRDNLNHHWYVESSPGATIALQLSREEQTTLSRMKSGHLRSMRFIIFYQ